MYRDLYFKAISGPFFEKYKCQAYPGITLWGYMHIAGYNTVRKEINPIIV